MPVEPGMVDFFVSRRGSAREVAQEVAGILRDAGYSVRVQDSDIAVSDNFVAKMHEMLTQCRHFIAILTKDYIDGPFTKQEWTAFLADTALSNGSRRLIPVRVEDIEISGLFAGRVYANLVGVTNPNRRRAIILEAATGRPASPTPRTFRGVPPHNPEFIGRDKLLDRLHETLTAGVRPAAITQAAIYGLGGIGKSSLAAEYAHRNFEHYAGVWWASAESRAVLIESLAELGVVLNRRNGDPTINGVDREKSAEQSARAALARLGDSTTPWLLVYDNVANPDEIRDFLPSTGARIVITTRWANWRGRAVPIEVDLLAPTEAVDLLVKVTGRTEDRDGATRLAKALGYLPLALDHAGAYISDAGLSFDEYVERALDRIAEAPLGASYPKSVSATFSLAIESAITRSAAAEKLLGFVSMFAPEQMPRDLIDDTVLMQNDRDNALSALHRVSLVKYQKDELYPDRSQAISVHRLVRAAMHRRLKEGGKAVETLTAAIARLAKAYPDKGYSDPSCWPRCQHFLPHVLAVREHARQAGVETEELAELLDGAANYLLGRGAFANAEPLFVETVSIAERVLGLDHAKVGQWRNNLGNLFLNSGRFEEAKEEYRKAISIGIQTLGRESPNVATRVRNLATALMRTGHYSQAEGYYLDAIETSVKAFGRKHPIVAASFHKLANLFRETGQYAKGEPFYREAIAIGKETMGEAHPLIFDWTKDLANLLRDTGQHAEGERLYREAMSGLLKTVGEDHSSVAFTKEDLAELLLATGRLDEALEEASQAVAMHEKSFGTNHRWTRGAAMVLNGILVALGRSEEATQISARYGLAQARAG